jgi:hypothetical protein
MRFSRGHLTLFIGSIWLCWAPHLEAQNLNSKINQFCNHGVNTTSTTIKLSIKNIVTLDAAHGANTAALNAVGIIEIDTMILNCRLFVGNLIDEPTFLATQSQVLQFALDVNSLEALAAAKSNTAASAPAKNDAGSATDKSNDGTKTTNSPVPGTANGTNPSTTGQSATSTSPGTPTSAGDGASKTKTPPASKTKTPPAKAGESQIKAVAADLGIILKDISAGEHTLGLDPVNDGIGLIIGQYSPIHIKD